MTFVLTLLQRILDWVERSATNSQLQRLRSAGLAIRLGRGVKIEHPECISLGNNVHINDHCWLSVLTENQQVGSPPLTLRPELSIGDRSYIGRFATVACIERISIGNDVMISDRVFIGDATHGYSRTDLPIRDQYMSSKGPIEIGAGTWIGIGASVLSNVKIGTHCVIGAGAIVVSNIPDFCIAVGVPAKIVRRIDD